MAVKRLGPADGPNDDPEPAGQVVARAVLAERRARRAELAEQAEARRAVEAERALGAMAASRAELERRLQQAGDEQHQRDEAAQAAARRAEEAEDEVTGLRERLRDAQAQASRLDAEVEELRRRTREAENALETATAARRGAEREFERVRKRVSAVRAAAQHATGGLSAARETILQTQAGLKESRAASAAARAAADALQRRLDAQAGRQRRAWQLVEELQAEVASLRGRPEKGDGPAAGHLMELAATAGGALEEAERRIDEARAATALMEEELERTRADAERARREARAWRLEVCRARIRDGESGAGPAGATWLARALRLMARDDPGAATRLMLALVPALALFTDGNRDFDVVVAEHGVHAVTLADTGGSVRALAEPRATREVDCRLELDAALLVELLAQGGGSRRLRRHGGLRVTATRRPRRALRSVPAIPLDLGTLAGLGVRVDPRLAYRALTYLIDPTWTRGQRFTVEQRVGDEAPWYVHVDDGALVTVTESRPRNNPSASVDLTPEAFAQLLAEPGGLGQVAGEPLERAQIRGEVRTVALLTRWSERARATADA